MVTFLSKPIVVVKLQGGLGNQMFQYASASSVARRRGADLLLDLRFLLGRRPRPSFVFRDLALNRLNVPIELAGPYELSCFNERASVLRRLLARSLRGRIRSIYESLPGPMQDEAVEGSGSLYMDGYWQNPGYFIGDAGLIRERFELIDPPSELDCPVLRRISRGNSVCIHVRRSDFVGSSVHPSVGVEYYKRAISVVGSKVERPEYFVFSDDVEYCKNAFCWLEGAVFVGISDTGGRDDWCHFIMRKCSHYVIANSTFSWWAAFLGQVASSCVVVPRAWFESGFYDVGGDLCLPGWHSF